VTATVRSSGPGPSPGSGAPHRRPGSRARGPRWWGVLGHPEPRTLHPVAWWIWAVGAAVVVTRTRNPLTLVLVATALVVVAARRHRGGAGRAAIRVFVVLGLAVIALRVVLTVLLGAEQPGTVMFTLPSVPLPGFMVGIELGGPVTAETLLAAFYEGLRLAVLLVCFGVANAVASPYRLVRSLPPVLHEVGVAVTVGVCLAPQLVVSVGRVRTARRLRGRPGGVRGLRYLLLPVLDGALERALDTASSMDTRGYGRRAHPAATGGRAPAGWVLVGVCALVVATYGLLDGTTPVLLGPVAVVVGAAALAAAMAGAGRRAVRTVFQPDPWGLPEWSVSGAGVAAAVAFSVGAAPEELVVATSPAVWPQLGAASVVAALLVLSAGWSAPQQPTASAPTGRSDR